MPHALHAIDACSGAPRLHPAIVDLLRILDIEEIIFGLSGGGDSGEATVDKVLYRDGRETTEIPRLPTGFSSDGDVMRLDHYLEHLAADTPDGDWINNEGGSGWVTIQPFAPDPSERLLCDMVYGYEDDDCDDEEDDCAFGDIDVIDASDDDDAGTTVILADALLS